jgi:lysophospholipase L1-like esterase
MNSPREFFCRISASLVDYFSAMVDDQGLLKKELSQDDLHPNSVGYAVMVPLAKRAIQAALRQKVGTN